MISFTLRALVGLDVLVRAALRRSPIEHAIAIQKGDLGLGHYEGRHYLGLLRHLSVCAAMGVFVAEQAARARVGNAEVTVEQVCRGLRVVCWLWQQLRRGLDVLAAAATIAYHQRRNAAARASHKKRFTLPNIWIVPEARMSFSPR